MFMCIPFSKPQGRAPGHTLVATIMDEQQECMWHVHRLLLGARYVTMAL